MNILHVILEILTLIAIIGVGLLIKFYLPSYYKKKGENLATREDIGKIEEEIQKARSEYSHDLEKLKSELTKKSYIYGVRYENEYVLLRELWSKLVDLKRAAVLLRPESDYTDSSIKKEKERRLQRINSAIKDFLDVTEKSQPFFPSDIYLVFYELIEIANKERIQYKNRTPENDTEYWDSAVKNAEKIQAKTAQLSELIRKRVISYNDDIKSEITPRL